MLIVWRVLQGAAMGAVVMCARAIVRDLYTPLTGARAMSKALTGLGVVACLCAPLGGMLAQWLGWRAALLALTVYAIVTLALVALRMPETLAAKDVLDQPPVGRQLDDPHIALLPGMRPVAAGRAAGGAGGSAGGRAADEGRGTAIDTMGGRGGSRPALSLECFRCCQRDGRCALILLRSHRPQGVERCDNRDPVFRRPPCP